MISFFKNICLIYKYIYNNIIIIIKKVLKPNKTTPLIIVGKLNECTDVF